MQHDGSVTTCLTFCDKQQGLTLFAECVACGGNDNVDNVIDQNSSKF